MALVNVDRTNADRFQRYKMPKIEVKIEGKGNGIKTVIVNMVEIGKSLNRPPMYIMKYLSYSLGAQALYRQKDKRYILNGLHESNKLQDLLDKFIKKYVLCSVCCNPETVLCVSSKHISVVLCCKACGNTCRLPNKNRFTTFIIKSFMV